ncbi:MAG: dockerin type I repeat-containing protein, partial [Gammaproteobacteria bacterium]
YVAGRSRPDLVAPFVNTSSSTPVIAAAAALLVDIGHSTALLSTDPQQTSTMNRAGNTIYNAERSEVVKAVLMAGADRVTDNTTNPDPATPINISDYRVDPAYQSTNGLDIRYGAGQLNIYNSFHILSAGEQNSAEDYSLGGGAIGSYGFDYDPSFGGSAGSNSTGSYAFSTGANPVMLTATLAWNIKIADSNFPGTATLHNMDLRLYDGTGSGHALVAESVSTIENTENLWIQLDAGRDYLLEVKPKAGQAPFSWDYALAWQMTVLVDTDSDGIPDNIDMDDDNDGLTDADEATYGTNPLLADSDSDGFDDAMEITYGSDPLLGSDTPAGNYVNNGDINIDGKVDAADLLLATRIVLGRLVPTSEQRVRADMVPDNQINAGDLVRIQRLALGL